MSFSTEEMAERRKTLGSSEIAAVAGINPYATMHDVYLSKLGIKDFEGNEATELGTELEPAILGIYGKRYGRTWTKGVRVVDPREPWMSASPDAILDDDGAIVEAKLVGFNTRWQWGPGNTDRAFSDAVPLAYLGQVQWQLRVTGRPYADVAALLGTEFRSYRIMPDARAQEGLVARGREFWTRYVLTRTPPPVDGSESAREMLMALYPRSGGEAVRATPEMELLAMDLRRARAAAIEADRTKREVENKFREALGDLPGAYSDAWSLRYRTTKTGTRPFVFDDDRNDGKAA